MAKLFGTDGVRGEANLKPMTPGMAMLIGRALVKTLKKQKHLRPRVAIGRDTRLSGPMIEAALAAGICSEGGEVISVGVIPTPGVAFLVRDCQAQAGVVISASHNPYQDNGIKIFSDRGEKLTDEQEEKIEDMLKPDLIFEPGPSGDGVGGITALPDGDARYESFCASTWPLRQNLRGISLVLDCGNGATWKSASRVFSSLGAQVTVINASPDGKNINLGCGSQYTSELRQKVLELGADAGLAFDGDGDRMIAVDEKGQELTGDHALAICARMYRDQGLLRHNLVVTTVMSNFGFNAALEELKIDQEVTAVGDRYVLERMKATDAVMGGEASGHMIFLDHHTTGDGIISGVQLLAAMIHYDQPLSRLAKIMRLYPQKLVNIEVRRKPPLEELPEMLAAINEAETELGDKGRILVRYSGTQPLCRVMVEADTPELTDRICEAVAQVVRDLIGI